MTGDDEVDIIKKSSQESSNRAATIKDFFKPRIASVKKPIDQTNSYSSTHDAHLKTVVPKSPEKPSVSETHRPSHIMFSELCQVLIQIEATTKRLEINDLLVKFFVKVMKEYPDDLVYIVYLCLSRLGPAYEGVELGLGEILLIKAIATATGLSLAKVKAEIEEKGDIGLVAETSRSNQRTMIQPPPLNVFALFRALRDIATYSGANAVNRKVERVRSLFVAAQGRESKYLFRLLEGKLRIGLAEQSVLAALAQAAVIHHGDDGNYAEEEGDGQRADEANEEEEEEKERTRRKDAQTSQQQPVVIMKAVYNSLPDYGRIIPALLKYPLSELPRHCHLTPGVPLKPMLAFPTKSISEVLNRFEKLTFTCEYKYDGERAQIHHLDEGGHVYIFSRNSEDMTAKYPDIMAKIESISLPHVHSYVLDCEVVAWHPQERKILPFQILSTRKRKDVTISSVEVEVCLFAFDLLYLNGVSLIESPFRERRSLLHSSFRDVSGEFHFAQYADLSSVDEIQAFLETSVQAGCEGLMVKTLDAESSYEPSRRSRKWLKVKKDYIEGVGDSLDLVVIGGYVGRGKRTGVYGGYLLACYDPDSEEYQAVCKIGTGFSEADLEAQAAYFKDHIIPGPKSYYSCNEGVKPDVWFEPTQVWEVKAADFSLSPIYSAARGMVDPTKGISLRFPRYIRTREDKVSEEASTSSMIAEMYRTQTLKTTSNDYDEEY